MHWEIVTFEFPTVMVGWDYYKYAGHYYLKLYLIAVGIGLEW